MPIAPANPAAAAREIVHAWRQLTSPPRTRRAGPGARTLVACSAGADSSALALALAGARKDLIVLAHVVHDLRPREQALADRDAARALANRLGVAFVEASVLARAAGGNAEATARRLRYAALAELARTQRCGFVATAHHAHDQAESVLMALLRGAGPRGLAGIAPARRLAPGVTLIRPMLGVTPALARAICQHAGWSWRDDATNADVSRLRAGVRHTVLPALVALRPGAAVKIAGAANIQRGLAQLLDRAAGRRARGRAEFTRAELRRLPPALLGEVLRRVYLTITRGAHADALSARTLAAAARLIRSSDTDPHRLEWPAGVRVVVSSRAVRFVPAS